MATTTTNKTYSLDEYRSEKEKELARAREAAKREADIGFAKLQKYLQPSARTAAQGYSQGLSETAMIAAENSRQRAHAAADSAYTAGYNDLMAQYRTEKTAEQQAMYDETLTTIEGGAWNTTADLKKYLYGDDGNDDGVGGVTAGLTEAQRAQIAQRYGSIAQSSEQQASDNAYEMTGLGIKKLSSVTLKRGINREVSGDNFVVSDGDNNYRVEIGQEIDAGALSEEEGGPELLADLKKYIEDGEVFTYKGNLLVRDGDKFYTIRGRGNRNTKQINALKAIANQ